MVRILLSVFSYLKYFDIKCRLPYNTMVIHQFFFPLCDFLIRMFAFLKHVLRNFASMEIVWMLIIVMIVYLITVELLKHISIKQSIFTEESQLKEMKLNRPINDGFKPI